MTLAHVNGEFGQSLINALKRGGIEFVAALPDIVTSEFVLWPLSEDPAVRLVRVCKEDEGVSICAGLSFHGRRALLMMQNTGLLDSINAIRAIGIELEMPICMLVGLQGRDVQDSPNTSSNFGVRITTPILDAMGIEYHFLQSDEDTVIVPQRISRAYEESRPLVFLV